MKLLKNKTIIAITIIILLAISVIWAASDITKNDNKNSPTTDNRKVTHACQLFSLDDAKKVFGGKIAENSANYKQNNANSSDGATPNLNPDTQVTSCIYTNVNKKVEEDNQASDINPDPTPPSNSAATEEATNPSDISLIITLNVFPTDKALEQFNAAKPESVEEIVGLGGKAYWFNSKFLLSGQNQLSILKGVNVITISGNAVDFDKAKQVAELALDKL